MKTKSIISLLAAALTLGFASCKEDPIVENPSGETYIYSVRINNGDLSGGGRYDGVVDEEAKTVTFDSVSAESDITGVKFTSKISLGARFDQEAYNFLEGNDASARQLVKDVTVINGENSQVYTFIINLKEPEMTPIVNKITMEVNGRQVEGTIDTKDKVIFFNSPEATEAKLVSLSLLPLRTEYVFTDISDEGIITKANPGTLKLDFLGMTDEYTIDFSKASAAGVNFSSPTVYDFSVNTTLYPDFAAENTRNADFDGKYVLLVSRASASEATPKLFDVKDLMTGSVANPIMLNVEGVSGGTHVVSAGRLAQGRVYICNLSVGLSENEPLKIYYWETPTSAPKVVCSFDGTWNGTEVSKSRFGDNMTINLDAQGNGYAYFVRQDPGDEILRLTVTNFETFSDPLIIRPTVGVAYYAYYNQIGSENLYLLTSTYTPMLLLLDADGNMLYSLKTVQNEGGIDPTKGTDARIFEYNKSRYLIMTGGRRFAYWPASTLIVYDITEGFDVTAALVNMADADPAYEPVYSYAMDAAFSAAPSANAAWGEVDGKLVLFTAAPHSGFALIAFDKNEL